MSTGAIEATPIDEIDRLFTQNAAGAIRVTQAVLPQLRQRHHVRLLFVSSFLARFMLPGLVAYSASKAPLEAFAEGLVNEVRPEMVSTPEQVAAALADLVEARPFRSEPPSARSPSRSSTVATGPPTTSRSCSADGAAAATLR
jgi:short-subunit dehydrogenase